MKGAGMSSAAADLDPNLFYTVTDKNSGDQYDVRGESFRADDHQLVADREPSDVARPHKSRTDKAGKPAPRQSTPSTES